jgi:hypothetical protein
VEERRVARARRDRVHGDAARAELPGERAGERLDRRLRARVRHRPAKIKVALELLRERVPRLSGVD